MANSDAAFGFRPVNRTGSPYSGAAQRCVIASGDGTATFAGDAVKLAGSSVNGYPTVIQCAAGDPVFGVVTSFEANGSDLSLQYRAASTQRFCQVAMASDSFFEVQADDDTTTIAATDVGLNADFVVGTGSTVTGYSAMELNSNTNGTSSALDLQIVALVDRADNEIGAINQNVIVRFNDPQDKPVRTGV